MKRKKKPAKQPLKVLGLRPAAFIFLCYAVYLPPIIYLRTEQSKMAYRLAREVHNYHTLANRNQELAVEAAKLQSLATINAAAVSAGLVLVEKPVYAPSVSPKP